MLCAQILILEVRLNDRRMACFQECHCSALEVTLLAGQEFFESQAESCWWLLASGSVGSHEEKKDADMEGSLLREGEAA